MLDFKGVIHKIEVNGLLKIGGDHSYWGRRAVFMGEDGSYLLEIPNLIKKYPLFYH